MKIGTERRGRQWKETERDESASSCREGSGQVESGELCNFFRKCCLGGDYGRKSSINFWVNIGQAFRLFSFPFPFSNKDKIIFS